MKILFISKTLAHPNFHGGCVYACRFLESLGQSGATVDYLWLRDRRKIKPKPVFRVPWIPAFVRRFHVAHAIRIGSFFLDTYTVFHRTDNRLVQKLCRQYSYDAVILDYLWDTAVLQDVDCVTGILTHELMHQRAMAYEKSGQKPDFKAITREDELHRLNHVDLLIAIQQNDADWMRANLEPAKSVVTAPLPANLRPQPPAPEEPPSILFIGGSTAHNVAGLKWFIEKVFPRIMQEAPQAELRVYGAVGRKLGDCPPQVRIMGPIDTVAKAYADNQVAIVPLLFGSGLKIKLVEAMACGRPVVATRVGAEGFADLEAGKICPVSDDPSQLAREVLALLKNPQLREEVIQKQSQWLKAHTDSAVIAKNVICAINSQKDQSATVPLKS